MHFQKKMIMYAGGTGLSEDEIVWKTANDQYDQYISNCRSLLKKYVSKNKDLTEGAAPLEINKARLAVKISTSQNTIQDFRQSTNILKGVGNISPFGADTKFDTDVTTPLGGGREMKLNGNRAQFYAARWSRKLSFGAGDIQNYGPPRGGKPVFDPLSTHYGWKDMSAQDRDSADRSTQFINSDTGLVNFFPS